jgi:two-component system NtrC family sensor kinase
MKSSFPIKRGHGFRWLTVAAVIVPVVLLAVVAQHDYGRVAAEITDNARSNASLLREHAIKVLEQHELVLRTFDERVRGMSWDEIEDSPELRRELQAVPVKFPHIAGIALADATGRLRAASSVTGKMPQISISDRDYFIAQREGYQGPFLSAPYMGRISGVANVALSLRRFAADGRFDGTIHVAVDVNYVLRFWESVASPGTAIALTREDGQIVVRYPVGEVTKLSPDSPLMQAVRRSPDGMFQGVSRVDGVHRITAYRQLGSYPAYVAYAVPAGLVAQAWLRHMLAFAVAAAFAALALAGAIFVARREMRDREAALMSLRREVDARERAEGALLQAQKMEAVGKLTGGIAHDFNNLLTVIIGNLARVEHDLSDHRLSRMVRNALRGAERASELTQQLLAFSRKQRLEIRAVDLVPLVAKVRALMGRTLGAAIEIETIAGPSVWPAWIDPHQTEAAILNLALNARDAMPSGGRLTITLANVTAADPRRPEELPVRDYVMLSVSDTGGGMTPEVARRAFEPFFTTKETGKGTGLGLSQVYGLAQQSGGTAEIESAPGRGTQVRLYFPRALESRRLQQGTVSNATA